MAIPQRVREDAAKAEEMLQQLSQPPAPAPNEPPPAPAENDDPTDGPAAATPPAPAEAPPPPPPASTVQPTTPETELQRLHQQLQSEQGRRAAQDTELAELRGRIQQLTEQLARQQQPQAPAEPPPLNLITDADRTDFGEDMIDFVTRVVKQTHARELEAALKRIGMLEGQMRQIGRQAQTAHKSAEELAAAQYYQTLSRLAPGWEETNGDQKFLDWLKNRDRFSRKTRQELLSSAHAEADAETVADFFKAYWAEIGATPAASPAPASNPAPAPSVDPSSLVAPAPSSTPTPAVNPRGGKIWTQAEIEQVYDDRMKKRISPEKFAELEAEISKAVVEGRVR